MSKELDNIFKRSEKAEMLEELQEELETYDSAIIILYKKKEGEDGIDTVTLYYGTDSIYEILGIIELTKNDIIKDY
jgi:hypothetical protein